MGKLSNLPNISSDMEAKLTAAGIDTPEKLREKGSRNAFMRVKMIDSAACYNMLLSLEGAIRGQLLEELDSDIRQELKVFMEIFNQ